MDSRYASNTSQKEPDQERRSRKLFIGGVSFSTSDEDFFKYFAKYGELEDCVLIREKDTGQSRGFGFVTYKDKNVSVHVADQQLYLDGRRLDPKPSISRYNMDQIHEHRNQTTKVFVGGLHDDTAEAELSEHFTKFGEVLEVNIMYDRFTNAPRGFGFVTFKEPDVAHKVITYDQDHMIHNKKVDCKPATARKDAFKRHDTSGGGGSGGGGGGGGAQEKSTSREERWRKYHGDSQMEMDPNGYPRPMHNPMNPAHHSSYAAHYPPPHHHPPPTGAAAAAARHSSYAHSSYHDVYADGAPRYAPHSSYGYPPAPPTHHVTPYPPAPPPHYPPAPHHSHYDPYYRPPPHHASYPPIAQPQNANESNQNNAKSTASGTTTTTGGAAAAATANKTNTTAATQHVAPPSRYEAYPPSYPPPHAAYPPPHQRYDYYAQYHRSHAAVGANTKPQVMKGGTGKPVDNIPQSVVPVAPPNKMDNATAQNAIPSAYGASRGSKATNSAQTKRYSAY